jgi:hypothetical protein
VIVAVEIQRVYMEEANPNERTEFTAAQIWEVCALSFNVEGKEVWNCPHCKGQFVVSSETFYARVYVLLRCLWPLMLLLRLCDSSRPSMGKVYDLVKQVDLHLEQSCASDTTTTKLVCLPRLTFGCPTGCSITTIFTYGISNMH